MEAKGMLAARQQGMVDGIVEGEYGRWDRQNRTVQRTREKSV